MQETLFGFTDLPGELSGHLRDMNPWWVGLPGRVLPSYRRWAYKELLRQLKGGLAPALVLRGPRQVGKTTLQEQMIVDLLREGVPANHILRIQFDDLPTLRAVGKEPILSLSRWFQKYILKCTFNEAAHAGQPAYVFLDEVQNFSDWAPQVKSLVDMSTVRVLVTGSSALRIAAGRDSLAGRIGTIELGPLLLREVAGIRLGYEMSPWLQSKELQPLLSIDFWRGLIDFGLKHQDVRDTAFRFFSERGGYPRVHTAPDVSWPEVADQLNESVIQRVIQHDLRIGERGRRRDQQLLEELFRLACRYAGQAPSQAVYIQDLQQALGANIGWQRVLSYLKFLDGSLLIKLIDPLELRLKRRKGNKKLCLCDHGLRASWLQEVVPIAPESLEESGHLSDLAGHLAESVTGYFLSGLPHLDLAHFPERGVEPEVDFVMTIGEKRIPVEVKYRRHIDWYHDTRGLRSFLEKTVYNAPFGILVTLQDGVESQDPRIVAIPLRTFLLLR